MGTQAAEKTSDTITARKAMIDSQLRTSGVNEEFALKRMMAVAREDFLPERKRALAYIDRSVAVDGGALASPLFYGKALLEAVPTSTDNALIVEGGTGYLTALVEPLIGKIEAIGAEHASTEHLQVESYTLIMIDGAIEQLPRAIFDSLREGGRIVSGLLQRQVTRLASGRKVAGRVSLQAIEDLGIPVLHAFDAPKKWTFT